MCQPWIFFADSRYPHSFVEIRSKLLTAPESCDATKHVADWKNDDRPEDEHAEATSGDAKAQDKTAKNESEEEGEIQEGDYDRKQRVEEEKKEKKKEEDREEGHLERGIDFNDPKAFPLAQLFSGQTNGESMEIKLTFPKSGVSKKHSYSWVWPCRYTSTSISYTSTDSRLAQRPSRI